MPRPKKTDAQRRSERFLSAYRSGKARTGLFDLLIAAALGIAESTFRRNKKDPCDKFSINQFATLADLFGWTDEEIISIIRAGQ